MTDKVSAKVEMFPDRLQSMTVEFLVGTLFTVTQLANLILNYN